MRSNLSALLAVLLSLSAASAPAPAATPSVHHLGNLGGTGSGGFGVNDAGQVAGNGSITGSIDYHAFRYDGTPGSGGVMRDLGTLGGSISAGFGVNDAGQVAGYSRITGNTAYHAFRYDGTPGSGGVMRDLGTLPGRTSSYGHAINDAGQVAGYSEITFNTDRHAFRYDGTPGAGGVMRDLGTFGGTQSYAFAVNNAGQVAGYSDITGDTAWHAFRYDGTPGNGGVMRDLGTLGGTDSRGNAVNDAGQVAGYSRITGNTAYHAFRYDGTPGAGGVMRDLGTLGGSSFGNAVNDAGQVAGESAGHAFLYTGTPGLDGQMLDLDTWLDANNPTEGAKWTLTWATGLSNTGWITGSGLYDPDGPGGVAAAHLAYLLDASSLVPEPASLSLTALGGIFLLRRRRCHGGNQQRRARPRLECLEHRTLLSGMVTVATTVQDYDNDGVADSSSTSTATYDTSGNLISQVAWSPAAIVHYGNDVAFPDSSEHSPDYLLGSKYTVTQPIVLQKAGIIFKDFVFSNAKVGIYTDAGGWPHTLVAETGEFSTYTSGVTETPLLTTPTIPAGDYWFMAVFGAYTSGVGLSYDDSVQVAYIPHKFNSPLPATIPAVLTYTGQAFNYYLVGTTIAEPGTKTFVGPGGAGSGGNWSTASNWSPSGVPAAGDVVTISGKTVNLSSSATVGGLNLLGGATLNVGAAGNRVLRTSSLTITGSGSTLNLIDNGLILDYSGVSPVGIWTGSAYDGVTGMIQSGRISSSLASGNHKTLGVAEVREALNITGSQTATFTGESVDSTAVLVKFTWGGDANLDGRINIDDYGQIDANVASSGSVFGWFNGDFNYDGKINIDDYGIIDGNISQQDDVLWTLTSPLA